MAHQPRLDSLTEREREIARLIAAGLSNHEIAEKLVLTHGTVKWYCGQIYSKLGVNTRAHAVKLLNALHPLEKSTAKRPPSRNVQLPTPLTPLIGRQQEIAAISHLLQTNRLLTLTGPGGTGKTRLAIAVAGEVAGEFSDGVSFVDLAPLADASWVVKAIGHGLGVIDNPQEPTVETLKRALAEQEHLLLIDNFEHVIDSAPIIPQLLASAPRVKILATSREALRVSGEQEYVVPALTLPSTEGSSLEDIQQSEAVSLFVQRVRMVLPDFQLTDDNASSIALICTRLDGLALAIELAAARCKLLPPQVMAGRLDSPLNILTGGARDAPARQQTLRRTIEWSYNLLDDGEKTLFARLAVFRGDGPLEAIEAICTEGLPIDVLNGLASLLDKNLMQQKVAMGGEPRFVMLETLHEFASERLHERGEAEALRRRHADYYVTLAERAEPELHHAEQQRWSQRLETERDNLRLALEWSLENDVAIGLRLAGALWWHWFTYGYHDEGYLWTQELLPRLDEAPIVNHPKFLVAAGHLASLLPDLPGAQRLLRQALETARTVGDTRQAARALMLASLIIMGERDQASALAQEGLALFRELDDKADLAWAFNALGEIARVNGQDDLAKRSYARAIALAEQTGNIRRQYVTLVNMSYIAQHENAHARAIALLRQTLVLARDMKNDNDMSRGIQVLSGSLAAVGEPERAARLLGTAEAARERIGAFVEPQDRSELGRNIASVRSLLDETTFQAAWAEGRRMSLEWAVAEALGE
jgi:predicted ATPase/DNA-binding CsgD family transcriptional regulator